MGKPQIAEQLEQQKYDFEFLSGQGTLTLSGCLKLHAITVGKGTSGQVCTLYNSSSGEVNVVGLIACGDAQQAPVTLTYDIELTSGLVLVTMGALWNICVTYKKQ